VDLHVHVAEPTLQELLQGAGLLEHFAGGQSGLDGHHQLLASALRRRLLAGAGGGQQAEECHQGQGNGAAHGYLPQL